MPTSLSPHPNLEQLKKQAKDLRKAHRAGGPEAARRLKAYIGRFSDLDEEGILAADLALRDAQHVTAREHGYAGWLDMLEAQAREAPRLRQLVSDSASYTEDQLLPVQLLQVEIIEASDGSKAAAVALRGDHDRVVFMTIGEPEGMALARYMKGAESPRPLTEDLFSACLEAAEGVVSAVVVHELSDTTFLAHVVLEVGNERRYVDARPSDCLNLAARLQAPIFVTRSLMERAGRPLSKLADFFKKAATYIEPK